MTRGDVRRLVQESSVERHKSLLLDLREHEAFFKTLADEKLRRA